MSKDGKVTKGAGRKQRRDNYRNGKRREYNKSRRIARNILSSKNPAETAFKIIETHPNNDVKNYIRQFLSEKDIKPVKPQGDS
jgi:hypothetical protein